MLNSHYLRQVNIIFKFKQKYQCLLFFNKLDMNPSQVKVSSVSKCTELRIISEALSSQVWSLTWRHLPYHDVDAQEAQTLGGQHKYLPVEAYIGWDDAYDTCWSHNQLDLFSLNRLYIYEASVAIFNSSYMIYGDEKTLLMRNWHCVGWPGIRF